jgi:hypothetical protein
MTANDTSHDGWGSATSAELTPMTAYIFILYEMNMYINTEKELEWGAVSRHAVSRWSIIYPPPAGFCFFYGG